ncbi:MAG: signal peptidase II [Pelagibacteraceae bacterium TMED232]|nr:MAG: signal peptidase II [Pelagibacteraceae bacterium TMED232]|tara:strand:+ start:4779 stop:5261 length:483 start_codon:yes stop_codon:yes gene_type:complete
MIKSFFSIKFVIIFLIFLIDQVSKYYIINIFEFQNEAIYLSSFLNFQLIWNEGIAFGLLSFENNLYYNSITFVIIIVISILLFLIKNDDQYSYFYSMIVGGALGNLIDRIRYSSVPDFIDFHISNFHWFVFNIADIFVSLGVICLIVAEIFFNKNVNEKN